MLVAIHFAPRPHQHVGGHGQPAEAFLGALVASNRALVALWQNHHQVHIAVLGGRAPGVRAEQPDLLRLKFRHQPLCGCLEQIGVERFHGFVLARGWRKGRLR